MEVWLQLEAVEALEEGGLMKTNVALELAWGVLFEDSQLTDLQLVGVMTPLSAGVAVKHQISALVVTILSSVKGALVHSVLGQ